MHWVTPNIFSIKVRQQTNCCMIIEFLWQYCMIKKCHLARNPAFFVWKLCSLKNWSLDSSTNFHSQREVRRYTILLNHILQHSPFLHWQEVTSWVQFEAVFKQLYWIIWGNYLQGMTAWHQGGLGLEVRIKMQKIFRVSQRYIQAQSPTIMTEWLHMGSILSGGINWSKLSGQGITAPPHLRISSFFQSRKSLQPHIRFMCECAGGDPPSKSTGGHRRPVVTKADDENSWWILTY